MPGLIGRKLRASAITVSLSKLRRLALMHGVTPAMELVGSSPIDNLARRIAKLSERCASKPLDFLALRRGVRFALWHWPRGRDDDG